MLPLNNAVEMLAFLLGTSKEVIRRFVRVLRESGRGFFNDIGKGQKGGILLRSLLNTILTHEMTNGQPTLALEAASAVNALRLTRCTTKIGGKTEDREAVSAVSFMQVLEEIVRMAWREAEKEADNQKSANALLPQSRRAFGTVRITFGGWIDGTMAEIDWPEQGGLTTFFFTVPDDDERVLAQEDFEKPHNYFSRKTITIRRAGLEAFARLARATEDFDADLNTSSEPVPGSTDKAEGVATREDTTAAGTGIHSGRPEYPVHQAQAAPDDPRGIKDSLPEGRADGQPSADLSGPESRDCPRRRTVACGRVPQPRLRRLPQWHAPSFRSSLAERSSTSRIAMA